MVLKLWVLQLGSFSYIFYLETLAIVLTVELQMLAKVFSLGHILAEYLVTNEPIKYSSDHLEFCHVCSPHRGLKTPYRKARLPLLAWLQGSIYLKK